MDRLLSFRLSALGLFWLPFSLPLSHVFGQRFCVRYGGLCEFGGGSGEEAIACTWDQGGREGLEGVGKGLQGPGEGLERGGCWVLKGGNLGFINDLPGILLRFIWGVIRIYSGCM